ncbi:predicted protein [Naegleria gruberi]|uniref:arginine--tRNA ligase n=1 Tax=Naegleria gruberi TaxID=5762 RepID=D2VG96_NAEGR|nr:uncharacterized protein NAEGRDRAFT_33778 [Naegleria gruberi]EFC44232.1 predicted protein [Naegleria gruberi]|eukprot:XP_002676976.1 predicted protein [Naegleria gruberi strain NEG-M]
MNIASDLAKEISRIVKEKTDVVVENCVGEGPYVNFFYQPAHLGKAIEEVHNGNFLSVRESKNENVMIEYSQPNTHKTFHVGHMRNAALGNSLVLLYEWCGYNVHAVNYIGDVVDKQGVISQGFILSQAELGSSENKEKIHIFPADSPVGIELTELGRKADCNVDASINIGQEFKKRESQCKTLLRAMEDHKKNISMLWEITRTWSIEDFKSIYKWSDCRFDHFFHESDVGDESKEIVLKAYEEGKLIKSDGAIGADLGKLGFCVLLTSAGTGLYATKDLALAKRKFEEFKVDRSVYVVDVSQSLHFQQVFKTLEVLGFEQAKKCKHLAYGMVVLPDGKMSSRKGNIIYFSTLQKSLTQNITDNFMSKYEGEWPKEEIEETTRKIAISAIKYGMLNQDNNKDITFVLKEWASKSGNTGPYLMYAYARAVSVVNKIGLDSSVTIDYSLLTDETERKLLSTILQYSIVVERAAEQYKPQLLCIFLYNLCKQYSKMYEAVSIRDAATPELKQTRLRLVAGFAKVLKHGLGLLGISTAERM